MFTINSNSPTTYSNSTPISSPDFLTQLGSGHLSPAILLGLTDEQIALYLSLIIKDTQTAKPLVKFIKNWGAFLHRVQLSPIIGTYFYWLGSIEGIFKRGNSTQEGDISVFCRTKELEDTEAFFQRFMMYWDKLGSGYMRDNLNLVDPISGRRIKTIKAEQRRDNTSLVLAPLEITMSFHGHRGTGEEKTEDKGRIYLRKGIDIRGTLYFQTLMNVFNCFWAKKTPSLVSVHAEIKTYKCIPINKNFGCIELLEPMSNIRTFNWAYMAQVPDDVKLKFLASLAAAVTVSWIMGFRDKLEEFIFVHEFQIVLSGIEKMHFWTAKPYDTDFFLRIKPQLNMLTGNNNGWAVFTQYCLDTFKLLHEKGSHVSNITSTLFNGIHEKQLVEEFFTGNKGLMCTTPQPEALISYSTALQDTVSSLKGKLFKKITSFKIKT